MSCQEEVFPLVDEAGNVIGQATRSECHRGSMLLHPVIHLHVFNSRGDLFLQKRSAAKDIQPNLWDSSVGGHIDLGETPYDAAIREAGEEIGLQGIAPIYITKHIITTDVERELTYCFYAEYDKSFQIDNEEVSDGRFWTMDEIEKNMGKGMFTYNFELDFGLFLKDGFSKLKMKYHGAI
ncbi:NUDIX domain-containing protein [Dysgonomonas sp. 520]|uniref:NUDIX hydrolase n=1 Tax=Dysgonomonas sp. 520 TaxID=2302931 RepID=UPI0013D7D772|nr:NUDIX domain-containing protein [Dysgonomonas sp. 520]NDW10807.1 NUDIX domain-containing protein [Dysgonomonas sp. 520]